MEEVSKMDKSIVGLITIGILCYLVAMAGVAILIAAGIVGIIYLCVFICKKLLNTKTTASKNKNS